MVSACSGTTDYWSEERVMGKQLRFLLNLTADDIDLISRACWNWMGTIDSEQAEELDIPLDKLGNAVDKLTEKEIKDA
jgi:hypothetical protein